MKILISVLAVLLWIVNADAAIYYVKKTGSDSNDCTQAQTEGTPKLTINSALACLNGSKGAGAGHTVRVYAGTYVEFINAFSGQAFPSGTSWSSPFTLEANSGDTVTIKNNGQFNIWLTASSPDYYSIISGFVFDGTDLQQEQAQIRFGTSTDSAKFVRIQNNEFINNVRAHGIFIGVGSSNNEILKNKIHGGGFDCTGSVGGSFCYPIYQQAPDILYEGNEIYDFPAFGLHIYDNAGPTAHNTIIRGNIFRDFTAKAILMSNGSNIRAYNNLIYNGGLQGIGVWNACSDCLVYNNTIYNMTGGEGISTASSTNAVVKNNISYNNAAADILTGSGTVASNNLTTNPSFVSAGTGNFSLQNSSTAIDAGTASITTGVTLTCAGNCDIGVFEVPKANSCSATGNTLSISFDNPRFPPLMNLATTGITGTIDSTSRTLSAPTLIGTNQVNFTFSGAAVTTTATTAGSGVAITDSAKIGNITANVQKVLDWSTLTCNVTGGGGAVVAQTHFAGADLPGTIASPVWLRGNASNSTGVDVNFTVQQGGCFRCTLKVACTGADCLAFAPQIRYKKNAGSFTAVPDAFDSDNFKYYGTSDTSPDIPTHLAAISVERLTSDHASNISAAFLRNSQSIPNIDLSQNSESEIDAAFCIDRDESVGTTYQLRVYKQDGTTIDSYTQTPTITVVAPGFQQTGQLGPWDVEIRLGSALEMGKVRRRTSDRSRVVYPDVPRSSVVRVIQ